MRLRSTGREPVCACGFSKRRKERGRGRAQESCPSPRARYDRGEKNPAELSAPGAGFDNSPQLAAPRSQRTAKELYRGRARGARATTTLLNRAPSASRQALPRRVL